MVRRLFLMLSLTALAVMISRPCLAAPLTLTGNTTADFNPNNLDVQRVGISTNPNSSNYVTGFAIKNIWTYYDSKSDTLQVGVELFKDNTGQPSIFGSNRIAGSVGPDSATFEPGKSFAMAFASGNPSVSGGPAPSLIAGIPYFKELRGSGIDGFNIARYNNVGGLNSNFGTSYGPSAGSLAFHPSSAHPDAEFTINNFSTYSGINPSQNPLWINLYAGAGKDGIGEVSTGWIKIPAFASQETPEPATWLAWSAMIVGGAAFRSRRKRSAV